jgi:putative hydrolase of the HAD superfamily
MRSVVVFDLDDTLFPEREFVLSGFQAVARWLRLQYGVVGFGERAAAEFDRGNRCRVFDVVLNDLGRGDLLPLVPQVVQIYREHEPTLNLFPDAAHALNALYGHQRLGLITDGYLVTQRRKVEALGIADLFAAIIYSDLWGRECWKPSPVPYQQLMARMACTGSECVYVGDNPLKDFIAPRALGWLTVQVQRPTGVYAGLPASSLQGADKVVPSLTALVEALRAGW